MADLYKTFGQDMLFKTPEKFCMRQRHYFLFIAICVIFVLKANVAVIYVQNPVGGDGDLVCIAAIAVATTGGESSNTLTVLFKICK